MKRYQSTLEYALVVGIIAMAIGAMVLYVQRSVQANLKLMDDKINAQPVNSAPSGDDSGGDDSGGGDDDSGGDDSGT